MDVNTYIMASLIRIILTFFFVNNNGTLDENNNGILDVNNNGILDENTCKSGVFDVNNNGILDENNNGILDEKIMAFWMKK